VRQRLPAPAGAWLDSQHRVRPPGHIRAQKKWQRRRRGRAGRTWSYVGWNGVSSSFGEYVGIGGDGDMAGSCSGLGERAERGGRGVQSGTCRSLQAEAESGCCAPQRLVFDKRTRPGKNPGTPCPHVPGAPLYNASRRRVHSLGSGSRAQSGRTGPSYTGQGCAHRGVIGTSSTGSCSSLHVPDCSIVRLIAPAPRTDMMIPNVAKAKTKNLSSTTADKPTQGV
jgi:hypothetical protein